MAIVVPELPDEVPDRVKDKLETKIILRNNENDLYYIAHNDGEEQRIQAGFCEIARQLKTGMVVLEVFHKKTEWEDRLEELGYDMSELEEYQECQP